MCDLIQELIDKKAKEINKAADRKERELNEKHEKEKEGIARNLLRQGGQTRESVASICNLPLETVNRLASKL